MSDGEQPPLGALLHEGGGVFRVLAPNADGVSVVGSFNNWDAHADAMERGHGVRRGHGRTWGRVYRVCCPKHCRWQLAGRGHGVTRTWGQVYIIHFAVAEAGGTGFAQAGGSRLR